MTTPEARAEAVAVYIRVCRDSRFKMPFQNAAHFAGKLLGIDEVRLWIRSGLTLQQMSDIADGTSASLAENGGPYGRDTLPNKPAGRRGRPSSAA